jgi:hypothetical protein
MDDRWRLLTSNGKPNQDPVDCLDSHALSIPIASRAISKLLRLDRVLDF